MNNTGRFLLIANCKTVILKPTTCNNPSKQITRNLSKDKEKDCKQCVFWQRAAFKNQFRKVFKAIKDQQSGKSKIIHFKESKSIVKARVYLQGINKENPEKNKKIKLASTNTAPHLNYKTSDLNKLFDVSLQCICPTQSLSDKQKGGENKGSSSSGSEDPPDSTGPSIYDIRKFKNSLPGNQVVPNFEPICNVPTEVFRDTTGEVLGPFAYKCGCYLNPEYFSFHNMSYYDLHLTFSTWRQPQRDSKRKP